MRLEWGVEFHMFKRQMGDSGEREARILQMKNKSIADIRDHERRTVMEMFAV